MMTQATAVNNCGGQYTAESAGQKQTTLEASVSNVASLNIVWLHLNVLLYIVL